VVRPTYISSSEPLSLIPFHSIDQLDKSDASPIPEAYTYPLASNGSSRSATPSQGTQFPSTTPLQSRSPPPGRGSPCAHQAYSAHRRYPIPSLPARVGLRTVRATLHLCLMPAGQRYSPLSASFLPQSFPTHYLAVSLGRYRRSPAQQGTLHCARRAREYHLPTTRRRAR